MHSITGMHHRINDRPGGVGPVVSYLRAGRGPFAAVEGWQTAYLPVYPVWAAVVVVVFPPLFGYQ